VRIAAAADVERRFCELAAHVHAATAELSRLAAEFHELEGWCGGWCGEGVRSFSHWLTINAGFSPHSGDELFRVGQALRTLPRIRAAFAAGQLSFDSVRELSLVATTEDEDVWLDVAAAASGAQLARICRACRRVLDLDTPRHADEQMRRRGVWTFFEDDGMLRLRALLLPEEGALVKAAIEATVREAGAERKAAEPVAPSEATAESAESADEAIPDPADEPWAARRADALVAVCEHALARDGGALLSDPGSLPMLVHVDVGRPHRPRPRGAPPPRRRSRSLRIHHPPARLRRLGDRHHRARGHPHQCGAQPPDSSPRAAPGGAGARPDLPLPRLRRSRSEDPCPPHRALG
jgi:Domain of unknown function (DUF222)